MNTFIDGKQQSEQEHQHEMQQHERPQSPLPIDLHYSESSCSVVCETPLNPEDDQTRNSLSPPPITAKTGQHVLATPKTCETPQSDAIVTNVNQRVLRRKRQRHNDLPPMIPGSPELYDTSYSNPFGRHVPIHSPIVGIDHTLDLGYIGKVESSNPRRGTSMRPISLFSRYSTANDMERRCSIESSELSYSSDESEGNFGFQTFLPALEDSRYKNDATFGKGKEGEGRVFHNPRRTLKMRRKNYNSSNDDIFEPTTYMA